MTCYPIYDLKKRLPESAFVIFPVFQCERAKVIWLNEPLLEYYKSNTPIEIDDDVNNWVIDRFAYRAASRSKSGMSKYMYAERYGGEGIGFNGGGARVALNGYFQAKGCGRTPLSSELTDAEHQSGVCCFNEVVKEALWGEVGNAIFPNGAVRTLAIISYMNTENGSLSFISVRENALRPAHFIRAVYCKLSSVTEHNMQDIIRTIDNVSEMTSEINIKILFKKYFKQWAQQIAFMQANRIMHGAITCSNLALDGRMIDFGTMTTLGKHCAVITAYKQYEFWREPEIVKSIIFKLLNSINRYNSTKFHLDVNYYAGYYLKVFYLYHEYFILRLFNVHFISGDKRRELYNNIVYFLRKFESEPFFGVPRYSCFSRLDAIYSNLIEYALCNDDCVIDNERYESACQQHHSISKFDIDFLNVDVIDKEIADLQGAGLSIDGYINGKIENAKRVFL